VALKRASCDVCKVLSRRPGFGGNSRYSGGADDEGLGAVPPAGSRVRTPVQGVWGEAPRSWELFAVNPIHGIACAMLVHSACVPLTAEDFRLR